MNKARKLLAGISFVLVLLFTIQVPISALESTIEDDSSVTKEETIDCINGNVEITSKIIDEIEDERSEYTKTFQLENGNKLLVEYAVPIHYQNDDDEWIEYDSTLKEDKKVVTEQEDKSSSDATESTSETQNTDSEDNLKTTPTEEITTYSCKNDDIGVCCSQVTSENNMVSFGEEDSTISWGYQGINPVSGEYVEDTKENQENEKYTELKNLTSTIKYESVYEDVDLNCQITPTGVKEDIILNSSSAQNVFDITYTINNLTAKQTTDNCITLYKGNEEKYNISAPYMTDANGDISDQVTIQIIEQKDGELKVRLTADSNFIRSADRSFPIVIDPEVTVSLRQVAYFTTCQNGTPLTYPPYVLSNNKSTVVGFNYLPEINQNERIISAKIHLGTENANTIFLDDEEDAIIVNAHDFDEITDYNVSYVDTVLDYDSLTYNDHEEIELDITRSLRNWYNNGEDDIDAIVLEAIDTIDDRSLNIKANNNQNGVNPILTCVYKDFTGTESSLSYHTVDAGHNATASISDYLGNLVLTQPLFEGSGSRLSFSASLTYNSLCSKGWQFSYDQRIFETSGALADQGYNYIYIDSDGTSHYLKCENDDDVWYDEDGLGLSLSVDEDEITVEN